MRAFDGPHPGHLNGLYNLNGQPNPLQSVLPRSYALRGLAQGGKRPYHLHFLGQSPTQLLNTPRPEATQAVPPNIPPTGGVNSCSSAGYLQTPDPAGAVASDYFTACYHGRSTVDRILA